MAWATATPNKLAVKKNESGCTYEFTEHLQGRHSIAYENCSQSVIESRQMIYVECRVWHGMSTWMQGWKGIKDKSRVSRCWRCLNVYPRALQRNRRTQIKLLAEWQWSNAARAYFCCTNDRRLGVGSETPPSFPSWRSCVSPHYKFWKQTNARIINIMTD